MLKKLFKIKRVYKKIIIITNDFFINILSSLFFLFFFINNQHNFIEFIFFPLVIFLPLYLIADLYNNILRYSGLSYFFKILSASLLYLIIYCFLFNYFYEIPLQILIFQPSLFFFLILLSRLLIMIIISLYSVGKTKKNIIIYGAGEAGYKSLKLLKNLYNIICIIDDDLTREKETLNGYKIYHPKNIQRIIDKNKIEAIYIAITNLSFSQRKKVINNIKIFDIQIKILPDLSLILDQEIRYSDFKKINEDDLIDRQINISNSNFDYMKNKKILITGGGGTIGSELALQLININISKMIIIDNSEYNLYKLEQKLESHNFHNLKIYYYLIDINNKESLEDLFKDHKPEVILHAAAYKHVPIVENNIFASIHNNFFASINLVDLAIFHKIKYFVYISSDKAVRPTNIMGATKRLSEIYIQKINKKINNVDTKFNIVRFGNVIGSSGSAVNLFTKQIQNGGPVTITHPNVTRYFMTKKEAALLIFECFNLSKKSEIFLLDMGQPIKILDLVKKMIKLYGLKEKNNLNLDGIEIKFTGLRKGEKIYEELLVDNKAKKTINDYIYISDENSDKVSNFDKDILDLKEHIKNNNMTSVLKIFEKNVESFKHSTNLNI